MTNQEGITLLVREGGVFCDKNVKNRAGLRGQKSGGRAKNDKFVIFVVRVVCACVWRRVCGPLGMFSAKAFLSYQVRSGFQYHQESGTPS